MDSHGAASPNAQFPNDLLDDQASPAAEPGNADSSGDEIEEPAYVYARQTTDEDYWFRGVQQPFGMTSQWDSSQPAWMPSDAHQGQAGQSPWPWQGTGPGPGADPGRAFCAQQQPVSPYSWFVPVLAPNDMGGVQDRAGHPFSQVDIASMAQGCAQGAAAVSGANQEATTRSGSPPSSRTPDVPAALCQQIAAISVREMEYSVTLADPNLPDCPLIGCSESFERLTGYSKSEIVGRNCRFLNKGTTLSPVVRKALRQSSTLGQEFIGVLPNRSKNGTLFLNLLHMSTLNVRGRQYVIGVQADVTHAKSELDFGRNGHIKEIRHTASRICRNIDAWVQMQAHEFAMRLPASALPGLVTGGKSDNSYRKKRGGDQSDCSEPISKSGTDKVNTSQMRRKVTPSTAAGEDSDTGSTNAPTADLAEEDRDAGASKKAGEPPDELPSAGSAGHPDHCVECMHFIFGRAGCRDGSNCHFCHSFHARKNPKKNRRHQKRFEALVAAANATIPEETDDCVATAPRNKSNGVPPQALSPGFTASQPAPQQTQVPKRSSTSLQTSTAADVLAPTESAFPRQISDSSNHSADSRGVLVHDMISFCYGEAPQGSDQGVQVAGIAGQEMRIPVKVKVSEANQDNERAFLDNLFFSVEPPLPKGLDLDTKTGQIQGVPESPCDAVEHVFTAALEAKGPNNVALGLLPVATSLVSIAVVDIGMYSVAWSSFEEPDVPRNGDEHPSTKNVRFKAHYEMK